MTFGPYYVGDIPAASLVITVSRNDAAVDLTVFDTVTIEALDPDGVAIDWDVTSVLNNNSTVTVPFPTTSPFAAAGEHALSLILSHSVSGVSERFDPVSIDVVAADGVVAWATVSEVESVTGISVSRAELLQAQAVIEVYANRSLDATDGLTARDLRHLRNAVAWQAAWQSPQYGYSARSTSVSVSQDGLSVQRRSQSEQDLAPLAARALKNLSWKCSRTVRQPRVETPRGSGLYVEDFLDESVDSSHSWEVLT